MTRLCPMDMASSSRLTTILVASIFAIMVLSPFAPTTSASSEEYEDPSAFIQSDWNVTLAGFSASIRFRYLGEAPLVEDNSIQSESSLLVNAAIQYERGPLGLKLEVFNLSDSDDTDITYFYESRLAGEPPEGVADVHYHPLEPRTVRLSFAWRL